ncbi:MAG TPA: peptidylprolyl isomerase [Gammaproteobacteria bacterium]|nr:peptidylprolyl isomerase [Gammaproteobacteria bacterium]
MSLLIGDNQVVSIHYTLTNEAGQVIDSSQDQDPLTYLHGAQNIIPGLEKALVGKVVGDKLQVVVQPNEGYGEIDPRMVQNVDIAAFQGIDQVEVGMIFEAQAQDGSTQRIMIKALEGDQVTIDANHPLAGVVLHFDVEITHIREATKEEIAHGHVH